MSDTIKGYLEQYGDIPFQERPMNHVDSLILCQFAYLKFDGLAPHLYTDQPAVTLSQLALHADFDRLFADERYEKDNRALFQGMLGGRRFRDMGISCYINIIEKEWETQFSAVTFFLGDGTVYVAFRGTDETIVGWKEDFNMAFLSPVPGQAMSVKYLEAAAAGFDGPFYVGGHSKGGNLAVYSAMNCAPAVQERIRRVYSMDGPGFPPEVLEKCGYEKIADRVVKLLPHSSLVGMLFEWNAHYQVVESKSFGLAQHNPYNWLVKDGEFVMAEDIGERVRLTDNTINEWLRSLDKDKARTFVDTLYQVIAASEAEDLIAFTADWRKSMNGMVAALKEVDDETAEVLREIVRALFETGKAHVKEDLAKPFQIQGKLRNRLKKQIERVRQTV